MALFNKSFLERLASLLVLGLIVVVFAQPAPLFPEGEEVEDESAQEATGKADEEEAVVVEDDEAVVVEGDEEEETGGAEEATEEAPSEPAEEGDQEEAVAPKKASAGAKFVGKASTVDSDLNIIEAAVAKKESLYAQAINDLVIVVGVIDKLKKADAVKIYAPKVYQILDKAVGMLSLGAIQTSGKYQNAETYTAVVECLKAVGKSKLFAGLALAEKLRLQTATVDVQSKIKGAVVDIAPFVQNKVIVDPEGFAAITEHMMVNKTQYREAFKNINMMVQPESKATPAQVEKLLKKADMVAAWNNNKSGAASFSGKEFFMPCINTFTKALNNWEQVFGKKMSTTLKAFVIKTVIKAQGELGTAPVFSASNIRSGKGLADEGTVSLQIGTVQAIVEASKTATFASAGDTVITLIEAFSGLNNVSTDVLTQVYGVVKALKDKCAWTSGALETSLQSVKHYMVVYRVVSAAESLIGRNKQFKSNLAEWLSSAESKIKEKGGKVPAKTAGAKTATEAKGGKTPKGTKGAKASKSTGASSKKLVIPAKKDTNITPTTKKAKAPKASSTTAVAPKKAKAVAAANAKAEKSAAFAAAKTPEEKAALAGANKKAKDSKTTVASLTPTGDSSTGKQPTKKEQKAAAKKTKKALADAAE